MYEHFYWYHKWLIAYVLFKVNGLIDSLVMGLRQDPSGTRQRCAEFMNACSSHGTGHSDKIFETAILGCTLDDQKRVKKRLQGLLDYIDKMHILELQQWSNGWREDKIV